MTLTSDCNKNIWIAAQLYEFSNLVAVPSSNDKDIQIGREREDDKERGKC